MKTRKTERIAELIKKHTSKLIQWEFDDFSELFITITDVQVPPDIKKVKIFYSIIGGQDAKEKAAKLFKKYKSQFRFQLGNKIEFKFVPEFSFEYDETLEKASHMENLFKKIKEKEKE